jgi:hypothetical protein
MATTTKENNEKPLFELKETKEDKLIFQRVINAHGKSKKEINHIVNQLPTATVHVMSEVDFQRLKKIEEELQSKIVIVKEKTTFRDAIFRFLEL